MAGTMYKSHSWNNKMRTRSPTHGSTLYIFGATNGWFENQKVAARDVRPEDQSPYARICT